MVQFFNTQISVSIWTFASIVLNIILPLLASFQWYRNHSREQAAKYTIFAARSMVEITDNPAKPHILAALDAVLATLNSRKPFKSAMEWSVKKIMRRFREAENIPLSNAIMPEIGQQLPALTKMRPETNQKKKDVQLV